MLLFGRFPQVVWHISCHPFRGPIFGSHFCSDGTVLTGALFSPAEACCKGSSERVKIPATIKIPTRPFNLDIDIICLHLKKLNTTSFSLVNPACLVKRL